MFPASRTWSVSQHPWERTHQEAGGVWTSVLGSGEGSSGGPAAPVLRRVLACPCSCSSVINRSQAAPWPENHGCHQATRCPSSDSKSSPCTCASSHVPPTTARGGGRGRGPAFHFCRAGGSQRVLQTGGERSHANFRFLQPEGTLGNGPLTRHDGRCGKPSVHMGCTRKPKQLYCVPLL